jgi:hypothetical protein
MSSAVYPTLPGLTFGVQRNVVAPPVTVKTTPSQREYRARDATLPRYRYVLGYEFLRSDAVLAELQALVGFFNARGGSFDDFLFLDPDDNTATANAFGIGDGTTTAYQLLRSYGAFAEPVRDLNGAPTITITDWRGTWTPVATNRSNTLKYSEEFQQADWSGAATVTADSTLAPDGTTTADTITDSSAAANHGVSQDVTITSGTNFRTFSVYVKKTTGGTSKSFRIDLKYAGGTAINSFGTFNTDTGTVINSNADSSGVIDGGDYWRVWISTQNNGTGNTTVTVVIYPAIAAYGLSAADPTQTGSAICWGAMLMVINGDPSDYIKTGSAIASSAPDYTIDSQGVVTFRFAPWATAALAWSGAFYRRVRFALDQLDTTKFMQDLWEARKVELLSTKP